MRCPMQSPLLRLSLALALALTVAASPALADIYRYVDEHGTTHFTNMPDDPRFKLYMKTQKVPSPVTQTMA